MGQTLAKDIRGPVEQLLELAVPGFEPAGRPHHAIPFAGAVPGFFEYLTSERGLRPASVLCYRHHLDRFEAYLQRVGVAGLGEPSPALLSAFVAERAGAGLAKTTVRDALRRAAGVPALRPPRRACSARDLSEPVDWPQAYRLSIIPRSISWDDVDRVLAASIAARRAGRRTTRSCSCWSTYGFAAGRSRRSPWTTSTGSTSAWPVPERKAGHSTAFPLSAWSARPSLDYLRHGRPNTPDRHVFFRAMAPRRPDRYRRRLRCARRYLLKAGIEVPRPGSHTLRHSAVQRLVDADFSLKTIGDFVGHRSAASTEIYAKVAVESLRQVALGDGEEVLA